MLEEYGLGKSGLNIASDYTGGGKPTGIEGAEVRGGSEWRRGPGAASLPSFCYHHYTHSATPCLLQGCLTAVIPPSVQVRSSSWDIKGLSGRVHLRWGGLDILL